MKVKFVRASLLKQVPSFTLPFILNVTEMISLLPYRRPSKDCEKSVDQTGFRAYARM